MNKTKSKGSIKRLKMFEAFSKNLNSTKELFGKKFHGITFEPDIDNIYVCPICFYYFLEESLFAESDNPLQLEHIPPGKLGGKVKLLTCKECNNTDGSKLEEPLIQKLQEFEFADGVPEAGIDVRFRIENDLDVAATLYKKDGNFNLIYDPNPKRSNPNHVKKLREIIKSGTMPDFTLNISQKYNPYNAEVALLRIAYLTVFATFGYQFLFLSNLSDVRQQILNPAKKILPALGTTSNFDFPESSIGINFISEPKELRSLLVVFDTKTNKRRVRHGVVLPGPKTPGAKIYEYMAKNKDQLFEIKAQPIPSFNYLEDQNFDYLALWDVFNDF